MKTLGVTGGIGSGKTTVCRLFEGLGARVLYADAEAKRLMNEDPEVRAELIAAFGAESYDDGGQLDRVHLAQQVFGDKEKVEQINAIVHPRVRRALLDAMEQAKAENIDLLVYEAALIFETGGDELLDAVAVVDAPIEMRVQRVMVRDGITRKQVHDRMGHQLPADELRQRADFVIENSGPERDLKQQVEAVYEALVGGKGH